MCWKVTIMLLTFNYQIDESLRVFPDEEMSKDSKIHDAIIPENLDKGLLPSSKLKSRRDVCGDLLHQLVGYTYNVEDEEAFDTLEAKLRELVKYFGDFVPKVEGEGLDKAVEDPKRKSLNKRIYKQDIPKPQKKTSESRVGRAHDKKVKHQTVDVKSPPECLIHEEIVSMDNSVVCDGPMVYDSNGTRITNDAKKKKKKKNGKSCANTETVSLSEVHTLVPPSSEHVSDISAEQDLLFQSKVVEAQTKLKKQKSACVKDDMEDVTIVKYVEPNPCEAKKRKRRPLKFTLEEKSTILGGRKLSDESINLAQYILSESFPSITGFQDTVLAKENGFDIISSQAPMIQLLHSSEKDHWVCAATIGGRHILCDSLRSISAIRSRDTSTEKLIALPYDIQQQISEYCGLSTVSIDICQVQQQSNGTDCGVFAIAFATHIANGINPVNVKFDEMKMRQHLVQCLTDHKMKVFPTCHKITTDGKFCPPEVLQVKRK